MTEETKKGVDPESQHPFNTYARLEEIKSNIFSDVMPIIYDVGTKGIEIEPETITVVAAQPGCGKSSLVTQWMFKAIELQPEIKVLIVNCELTMKQVMIRELSRISQIDARVIKKKAWTEQQKQDVELSASYLSSVADRFVFIDDCCDLIQIDDYVRTYKPDIVLFDYIQQMRCDTSIQMTDLKIEMDGAMQGIRRMVNSRGVAAIVVSTINRAGKNGYKGNIDLSRLGASSQVEYCPDDVCILEQPDTDPTERVLYHVKVRNKEVQDINLRFNGKYQTWSNRIIIDDVDVENLVKNGWN